jgi:hypothetical protein
MKNYPILVIGFNRPDILEHNLRKLKNENREIYVALDGPRRGEKDDIRMVNECRSIVNTMKFRKKVHTQFQDSNLGCKKGEQTAMNWFFQLNDAGIILEDDVNTHKGFLEFCDINLDKYFDNRDIWAICGFLPFEIQNGLSDQTLISDTPQTWGWASWRRTWEKYQSNLSKKEIISGKYPKIFQNRQLKLNRLIWQRRYFDELDGKVSTWDYQFVFSCWQNQGINIFPTKSLTDNIGFGPKATHTKSPIVRIRSVKVIKNRDFSPEFHKYDQENYLRKSLVYRFVQLVSLRTFAIKARLYKSE